MHRRTAHGNRIGLGLIGALLLLRGLALLGANRGTYGQSGPTNPLYPKSASTFVAANDTWLWPVAAAVAIILGLLFLRWLLMQTRVDRLRGVTIDTDDSTGDGAAGRTKMPAAALTDALEDSLDGVRGVRRAAAALAGNSDHPQLWLTVTADADADLGKIREHLSRATIPAAQTSLDSPDMPTYIRIDVSRRANSHRDLR